MIKRLGWTSNLKSGLFSFLFNQRLIHFTVIFLTALFIVINLTNKTQAVSSEEWAGKTFLAEIISSEFDQTGQTDELIEEFFDEEGEISTLKQTYFDNLTAIKSQPIAEMKSPSQSESEEEINDPEQSGNVIKKPELAFTNKIQRPREQTIYYIVEPGDTVSTIAAKFNISVNTILWENNLNAYSLIRPEDKLTILPMSGITYNVRRGDSLKKIAGLYGVEEKDILEVNKLNDANQLVQGQKLIIPGGKRNSYASQTTSSYTGISAIRDLLGLGNAKPVSGNKMNWPTSGYRITQYFSWRHHAIDIANKTGTPVYAADTGQVQSIGWGRGYGNQIVVDHGGGKKSLYAHLSKFYVSKGEQVEKGQIIGAMGSTGWSTGSHLHFEIVINGKKYNPLNYVK